MQEKKHKNYDNAFTATLSGIKDLFGKKEKIGELTPVDRLDGKTVLIDGSSSGLGFAAASQVARLGAKVIMACRSGIPEAGEKIRQQSANPDVHMLPVDFSDFTSITKLVKSLKENFSPVDIVICNAGIVPKKSRKTPQGLEEMFMVNYFAKFIFLNMLLEEGIINRDIQKGTPRIVFVSSESHRNPEKFNWEEFGIYKDYSIGRSIELYGYYKLLLTTFAVELSRRLNSDGVTRCSVFALCPGPVNSNIAREAPKVFHPLLKLVFSIFFKSPEKAAEPVVFLTASKEMEGKRFDYLFLMSRRAVDEKSADVENGERLWKMSEELWENIRSRN